MWFPTLDTFKREQHLSELDVLMRSKEQNYLIYEISAYMIKSTHHIIETACPSNSTHEYKRAQSQWNEVQGERERKKAGHL